MLSKWTCALCALAATLVACRIDQGQSCTVGQGGSGGGAGAGGETVGEAPQPVEVGFGAYAPACGSNDSYAEKADSAGGLGSMASVGILVPFPGTVVRVSVVHAVGAAGCTAAARQVLVSEPSKVEVPASPGLHEALAFSADEVAAAPEYQGSATRVVLARDLADPVHVDGVYDRVHVGSPFDDPTVCAVGCDASFGGGGAPGGSSQCASAQSWSGCAAPVNSYLAYVAWLDVVPD